MSDLRLIGIGMNMLLGILLMACSSIPVREAQSVVTQADSLWKEGKMYGVDAGDSVTLAQAYEILKKHSAPSLAGRAGGEVFSHACYHYGKLLRAKDNPVEAMQAFIAATHSGTRDYHILGRVYSNMGSICHLAGEFPLSYDMYERSADYFLRNGDSLLYFYGLNNKAFELAEQGKKEEALSLISEIEKHCLDKELLSKSRETKANVYERAGKYDSLLLMTEKTSYSATSSVFKARAFEYLGQIDSALYYAHKVMSLSDASEQNKYNMLYIILNYDSTLQHDDIIALSAKRSDIETDILIPQHNQWAMAVQLLEQDLNRETDWRWLYILVAIVLFAGSISILFYIWHKRKQHYQIITDIQEKEAEIGALSQMQETQHKQIIEEVENKCTALRYAQDLKSQLHWRQYDEMCQIIDTQFFLLVSKLKQIPAIKENDVRICVLVLLNLSQRDIARLMYVEESSVGKLKERTGNKLHTSRKNMRQELLKIIIGDKK
ncbi:MAG: hypothetical protein J6M55_03235 [Paludibacteraceae bacterium]|nr:hypothetical protein [Paludibacteraceae bacterium]